MPARMVPFLFNDPHEVGPEFDFDWTLCPEDSELEYQRRKVRNDMIKTDLLAGKNVVYRSSGHSLWPRVHSNDNTHYVPVRSDDDVSETDIVFCQVRGRYLAHLVKHKDWYEKARGSMGAYCYTISRLDGRENGWCMINTIYGRLVDHWR